MTKETTSDNHNNNILEAIPVEGETTLPTNIIPNSNENQTQNNTEQESTPEISASVKEYMKTINLENYDATMDRVRALRKDNKIDCCFDLLEAMMYKGQELFKDAYHIKLVTPYFKLGDLLLMKLENNNEIFGGGNNNINPNEINEREQEIEIAFQNLEIARVLLDKHINKENIEQEEQKSFKLILADVFKRLSDIESFKENFNLALVELDKGIILLEEIENLQISRMLSEFYFLKSCLYSYYGDHQNLYKSKEFAQKAQKIIKFHEEQAIKNNDVNMIEEMKLVLKTMNEKILDLEEEIKEAPKQNMTQIKNNIKKSTTATATSFPKSQFQNDKTKKINLGTFGKANKKTEETSIKVLKESVSSQLKIPQNETSKPLKKIQKENPVNNITKE